MWKAIFKNYERTSPSELKDSRVKFIFDFTDGTNTFEHTIEGNVYAEMTPEDIDEMTLPLIMMLNNRDALEQSLVSLRGKELPKKAKTDAVTEK